MAHRAHPVIRIPEIHSVRAPLGIVSEKDSRLASPTYLRLPCVLSRDLKLRKLPPPFWPNCAAPRRLPRVFICSRPSRRLLSFRPRGSISSNNLCFLTVTGCGDVDCLDRYASHVLNWSTKPTNLHGADLNYGQLIPAWSENSRLTAKVTSSAS